MHVPIGSVHVYTSCCMGLCFFLQTLTSSLFCRFVLGDVRGFCLHSYTIWDQYLVIKKVGGLMRGDEAKRFQKTQKTTVSHNNKTRFCAVSGDHHTKATITRISRSMAVCGTAPR